MRPDEFQPAEFDHGKRKDDSKPQEHQEELQDIRVHVGAESAGIEIDCGGKRPQQEAREETPSCDQFQEHTDHQNVGSRSHQQKCEYSAEHRSGTAIGIVQLVGDRGKVGGTHTFRQKKRKDQRKNVIRDPLHHPIGDSVPV